jgi:hypothetical protein
MTNFAKFFSDDAGAVTVDWIALTAGVTILGIMVVYAIYNTGVSLLVKNVDSTLTVVSLGLDAGSAENLNP